MTGGYDGTVPPRVVAFDGDDTLWHNETLFSTSQDRFRDLLLRHVDMPGHEIDDMLLTVERRNLAVYGYGIKGFMLSMVETAIEVTRGRIPARDIQTILRVGRTMLEHPIELIEGAADVLARLRARDHELWLITKGDLFDQESKIARSGLVELFHRIEIVSEKDEAMYRRLLDRHGVGTDEFAMVGNSLRSDVLPVAALGARAFHVPYHVTWAHERVSPDLQAPFMPLGSLPELLRALYPAGWDDDAGP
jgi:putative hydrolase of the HAD superfamily